MADVIHPSSMPFLSGEAAPSGALARCVGDVDAFAARHWGLAPLVSRGRGPFTDVLDVAGIAELLELTARRPTLRMVRDGTTISASQYTSAIRLGGTWVDDVADPARIAALLGQGATLVLQGLERLSGRVRAFTDALQAEISHPVQANAYLSPPGVAGLARHADTHDVLVLQISGHKSWTVDGLVDVDVAAGDVLYIPRGCAHAASTTEHHSLHVTVGISAVTSGEVVRRALADGGTSLDERLPLGFATTAGATAARELIADAIARAGDHLREVDPRSVLASEQSRVDHTRIMRRRELRDELQTITMTQDTVVRPTARALAAGPPRHAGERVVLIHDADEISVPRSASKAMVAFLAADRLAVSGLVGLDPPSRLVLARRLVRSGWAEIPPDTAAQRVHH